METTSPDSLPPVSDNLLNSAPSPPNTEPPESTRHDPNRPGTLSELIPYFLAYGEHEWRFSRETLRNYRDALRSVIRTIGDVPPETIRLEDVLRLKTLAAARGAGPGRVRTIVCALKTFLKFCEAGLNIPVIDRAKIRPPRVPRREVVFLTREEIRQFIAAIPLYKHNRTLSLRWLAFRAFVEVLLGTGMRISEALSLRRSTIRFERGEATIIGKGNKERTVFFSPRALGWLKEFLSRRETERDEVFTGARGKRLPRSLVQKWFQVIRVRSGLRKKVTAHILRHTVATTLLFNGCPIGHIKEILGHELLETTCKFYLGVDKQAAKEAHLKYLNFDS